MEPTKQWISQGADSLVWHFQNSVTLFSHLHTEKLEMKHLFFEQISTSLKENVKLYQTEKLLQREKCKRPTSRS